MNNLICPHQDSLMAIALGEAAEPGVEEHLDDCAVCKHQVDRLKFMVSSLRQTVTGMPRAETPVQATTGRSAAPARPAALGKYLIVGELGSGGQAQVFRALHPTLGRDVAIKWSRQDVDRDGAARLAQEGKLLADLDHPNIVRVFDLDVHEDRPFLVMEYVRGCDLQQYAARQKLTPQQIAAMVAQLARALAAAHAHNIIHQDIKPSNVLVDEAGQPRLSDFGIARIRDLWSPPDEEQPVGGTLAYMAPEQLGQPDTVSPASDLFALGGVLYFLLTGQSPRKDIANPALAYDQVLKLPIDFKPLEDKKVPRPLADICRKAMASDPKQRYQKAEDFAADLERYGRKPRIGHVGLLLAACLAGVLMLWGAFELFQRGPHSVVATAPQEAVAGTFTVDLRRDKLRHVLKTRADVEGKLPIRAGDQIGIGVHVPAAVKPGLFILAFGNDGKFTVRELAPLKSVDGGFQLQGLETFTGATATNVLFACGSSQAPTQSEVTAALANLAVNTGRNSDAAKLLLPRNILIAFQADKVDAPLGIVQDDPVQTVTDILEGMRERLRQKYDFVAGFAFTYYSEADATLGQVGGPRPDDPRDVDPRTAKKDGPVDQQRMFQNVMDRLLQTSLVRDNFPKEYVFPPRCFIKPSSDKELNAYAVHRPNPDATGKFPTEVLITQGYMNTIVKGDENILAAIMGHELTHLIKRHPVYYSKKELLFQAFSREQEIEADLEGVKIAVAANFPWDSGVRAAFKELEKLGGPSNFERLTGTHPTWEERLHFLDRKREDIWKAMAAFQNGYFFLHAEQYPSAAACFEAVTKEFPATANHPGCAEAWANLGYAKLMMYCDGLSEKNLRGMGIGQFVAGCFYPRPTDIFVRGPLDIDPRLWHEAVRALNKAKAMDEDLVLVRANLGLAYLVHPDGRGDDNRNIDLAVQYFRAADGLKDRALTGLSRAAFLTNFGVAELAQGKTESAAEKFRLARLLGPDVRGFSSLPSALSQALLFNDALIAAKGPQTKGKAFNILSSYLRLAPPTSMWWGLAYERYEKLGKEMGAATQPREVLGKRFMPAVPRLQTAAELEPGKLIILSGDTAKTLKILGREDAVGAPVTPRKTAGVDSMKRYANAAPGVDLLANHKILAIFLTSTAAPPVFVQPEGLGTGKTELHVGMRLSDFDEVMKDEPSERRYVDNADMQYVFYPRIGMGVRFERGTVGEIVLAQVPRR